MRYERKCLWSRASENYQCTIVMRRRHRRHHHQRRHQYNNIHLMITACLSLGLSLRLGLCVVWNNGGHGARRTAMIDMIGRWTYRKLQMKIDTSWANKTKQRPNKCQIIAKRQRQWENKRINIVIIVNLKMSSDFFVSIQLNSRTNHTEFQCWNCRRWFRVSRIAFLLNSNEIRIDFNENRVKTLWDGQSFT